MSLYSEPSLCCTANNPRPHRRSLCTRPCIDMCVIRFGWGLSTPLAFESPASALLSCIAWTLLDPIPWHIVYYGTRIRSQVASERVDRRCKPVGSLSAIPSSAASCKSCTSLSLSCTSRCRSTSASASRAL